MNKLNEDFKKKFQGSTASKPIKTYTGGLMLGVVQLHK